MRFKDNMIVKQIGEVWFAVSVGNSDESTSKMVRLNSTGKDIFDGLLNNKTVEEIADLLQEKYEVDREKAVKSTEKVIKTLMDKGVLINK